VADRKQLICFDPGHGGYSDDGFYDAGAVGSGGLREADVVLDICLWLKELAEMEGYAVLLTRNGPDGPYDLTPRAQMANEAGALVFVSVHCNSYMSPQTRGTETYCAPGSVSSRELAELIQSKLVALGLVDRGVKEAGFTVLTATVMPAVLVETAFISNLEEEKMLADPEFRQKLAEAVWSGIRNWLMLRVNRPSSMEKFKV